MFGTDPPGPPPGPLPPDRTEDERPEVGGCELPVERLLTDDEREEDDDDCDDTVQASHGVPSFSLPLRHG